MRQKGLRKKPYFMYRVWFILIDFIVGRWNE